MSIYGKGAKGKCDKLLTKILREQRGNRCEKCGSTNYLQTSHIISRRYSATRCELDNVQLLCAKDHMYFTHWPKEFSRWITESIGTEKYDELKSMAEVVTKRDWTKEYERLKMIANEEGITI